MWRNIVQRVGHRWQYGACALHVGYWGCTRTYNTWYLLLFQCKNGCKNARQYYVLRAMPVLLSPFCSSTATFSRETLPTSVLLVTGRTTKWIYSRSLTKLNFSKDKFNYISAGNKRPQHSRKSRISLPKWNHKFVNANATVDFQKPGPPG